MKNIISFCFLLAFTFEAEKLDAYLFRKHARAPKGQEVHEKVYGRRYERTSIVAGKQGHKIIAPLGHKGTMHAEFFEVWL